MAMDIQRQIADLKAAAPNSLTYTPVPLPNDDRSTRQQRHIELFSNECDNSPSSNKVADTDFVEFGGISEDEIKKSLMVEVKRRKFWNAKTIEKMTFEEVINTACYHYLLESFTESRCTGDVIDSSKSTSSSALTHENFGHTSTFNTMASSNIEFTSDCGTARISSAAGNAAFSSDFGQNPWDFDVQPDEEFVNQIKVLEMPNSHRMATCCYCNGKSLVHCSHCSGRGTDKCTYCRGTGMRAGVAHPALYTHPMIGNFPGHNHSPCGTSAMGRGYPFSNSAMIRPALLGAQRDKPYAAGTPVHFMAKAGLPPPGIGQHDICIFCHGRGICDCQHCKGQCKKNCMTCSGTGQVPVFTKLKVAFAVECTDYYTSCEVPELMLRQATGELIFSETRPYVQPIRKHQIKEINEISKRFCATHLKKLLDSCRVLKQRHCIERIEVAKVRFRLGSKIGHFFVFGKQRLCFIPKGSASSNCSVM